MMYKQIGCYIYQTVSGEFPFAVKENILKNEFVKCSGLVCKMNFCFELSSIPDKAGKLIRRRTQVNAEPFEFHANAITPKIS